MLYQKTVVAIAFVFIVKIANIVCCEFHANELYANCESFSELENLQEDSSWNFIKVVNSGNGKLVKLSEKSVERIPQVEQLLVDGVINGIDEGAFQNLKKLEELHLENNILEVILPGIFYNPNLSKITVNNSDVQQILAGSFANLPRLSQVFIVRNHIQIIHHGVFSNTNIKDLDLSQNGIQYIENNAFDNMKQLETLNLMKNALTSFDTQRLLGTSPSLSLLVLSGNVIHSLSEKMFDGLENLKELYLGHNNVETLERNCFHNLKNISRIDISNNHLKELSPELFPSEGTASLRDLFLHDNQLCFLSADVLKRMPNLKQLSYGGNPWQCPCWELLNQWIIEHSIRRVCHEDYEQGLLPVCFFSDQSPSECIYNIEEVKHVPQLFFNQIADYPKDTHCSSIF